MITPRKWLLLGLKTLRNKTDGMKEDSAYLSPLPCWRAFWSHGPVLRGHWELQIYASEGVNILKQAILELIYTYDGIFFCKLFYGKFEIWGGRDLTQRTIRIPGSTLLETRPWVLGNEYEWKLSSVSGEKGHKSVQENDLYLSHRNYQHKLPFLATICALILWIGRRNYLTLYLVSI